VFEAIAKGVTIDVGRGSHFSLDVARRVIDAGVLPHTLGADLHGYNITRATAYSRSGQFRDDENPDEAVEGGSAEPAFSLHYAMSELLALGVPLGHVIASATFNAAKMIREEANLGSLAVGRTADVAVIDLQDGEFTLKDGLGKEIKATQRVRPVFTVKAGKVFEPVSDYLPFWEREAVARRKPATRARKPAKAKPRKLKKPASRARTRKAA
jgi:dihydroorotase